MPDAQKKGDSQLVYEGNEQIIVVDANSWSYSPSIENSPLVMGYSIDKLVETPGATRIVFTQRKNFSYDAHQVSILSEIARLYNYFVKTKKILNLDQLGFREEYAAFFVQKRGTLQYLIYTLLRTDPLGCYVEIKRLMREERIFITKEIDTSLLETRNTYLAILQSLLSLLEQTKMVSLARTDLEGYELGDRTLYKNIFHPLVSPDFVYTRLRSSPPLDGEQIDVYSAGDAEISIYKTPGDIKLLYHIYPLEFKLTEDEYALLDLARRVLSENTPREEEFLQPERLRITFFNIGKDLLEELAENQGISLSYERIEILATVLVRYTIGFGILESILADDKIQDVVANSPIGTTPLFVVHQEYGECTTNILPSRDDGEGWATKFRLLSGRPLDEANPVLDAELILPGARSRASIITTPLSPSGLAYAFRRQRDMPWTLPLFMQNKMLDSLSAGLISFLIDGARTILVAGTRSSGKTSLLSSFIIEIMRKYRIITIEDTLELPVDYLRTLGYNIQHLKVRSALTTGGIELSADEGIRTSLRLGDSSLIVGEVRSVEARALYEAMRIGALANVVAGTIHGSSPYNVYDRVVNDLGVPKTSFKATDVIFVANPVKSADGLKSTKRLLQITEVRKHWEEDPQAEGGFVDLMTYDIKKDTLVPTDDLLNGESEVLKAIGGSVREWVGNWDAIWENILLRAKIKQHLLDTATKTGIPELLEASFIVHSNDQFHRISEQVKTEVGALDSTLIFRDWNTWLHREAKRFKCK